MLNKLQQLFSKKLMILCIILSIAIIYVFIVKKPYDIKFDQIKWNTDIESRKKMVDDLTENYLKGLNKDQVIELLGRNALYVETQNSLEYIIGPNDMDELGIVIYFDKNGIYESFKRSLFG